MIFVPSYKRANNPITGKWIEGTTYVVHEFEEKEYRESGFEVVVCPDSKRGNIAKVRNFILDHAQETGIKEFVIIDDDVETIFYWDKDVDGVWTHCRMAGPRVLEWIESANNMAKAWGVRLWGVNCATDKQAYRENTPFALKSYISGSFHGFINPTLRYDETIPLKEDYDYCLQELNETRRILRFNMVGMIKKDHKNLGGCSAYRTVDFEKEQMALFKKKWGSGIVKDDGGKSRVHRKREVLYDLNPIFRAPIGGV